MARKFWSIAAAAALCLLIAVPAGAAETAAGMKRGIDDFIQRVETATHGFAKWEGADRFDVRQDGDAAIAEIAGARIALRNPDAKPSVHAAQLTLDHVEIRREPAAGDAVRLSIVLPAKAVLRFGKGEIDLTLDKATARAILDAKTGRARETAVAFAGARLADKKSSDWIKLGPLSMSSKLVAAADGGWTAPADFELKKIEFFAAKGPISGGIDRIGATSRSAGPDLAALNRLRDRLDTLRAKKDLSPKERFAAVAAMLPEIPSLLSQAKTELSIEGIMARAATGQPLVALKKASTAFALTGMAGDEAALRITLHYNGLALAPAILAANKVPGHAVFDFGLEHVATGPLRNIFAAVAELAAADTDKKQQATQQMMGAAAMLSPVFRIYDLAVATPDVGVEATAEAKGSPLSPKGYAAHADVAVSGFDALPALLGPTPVAPYLGLLKAMGESDGGKTLKFHLASAPGKWLTLNGGDITAWFAGGGAKGEPRTLRLHQPPMTGADVTAVQHALQAAQIEAPQNGTYDGATAAAVARFQKHSGLNVDGVVDEATRRKLGVKPRPHHD